MDRKAALIACASGQWIRTTGMRGLTLNARIEKGTSLTVQQISCGVESELSFEAAGRHRLLDADWSRILVTGGNYKSALCVFETSKVEAA